MRDSRNQYILVGTFLLAVTGALLIWLTVLSGSTEATTPYYIEFENVIGLTAGGQILYEGYPVGEIQDITLTRQPKASVYRLDVTIREGWDIPNDSLAVITQASFLSSTVIDIQEGTSTQMLAAGDRISSLGATNLLTTMSSVAAKLGDLADGSLKPLLDNLSGGTDSLSVLSHDVPVILGNLKTFTAQLNNTTERLNRILDRSGGHVETILVDAETASGNLSVLTRDVHRTSKRLDALLQSIGTLVTNNRGEIDHSVSDLHHTLEVLASHVQEISSNLESTTRNLSELTADIRRNPGVIVRGREVKEQWEIGR